MRNKINLTEARKVLRDNIDARIMAREDEAAVFALFHQAEVRRAAFLPGQFVYGAGEQPSWGLGRGAVLLNARLEEEWVAVDEHDWPRLTEVPRYASRVDLAAELMRAVFPEAEFTVESGMGEFLPDYRMTMRVRREQLTASWTHVDMGSAIVGATISALIETAPADAAYALVGAGRYDRDGEP